MRMVFGALILALLHAGCRQSEPPTAGESTTFAAVCDRENDGERVSLEGYLRLPDEFTGDSVVLWFHETDEYTGEPIGVQVRIGNEPNQIGDVPTSYSDRDLIINLADDQWAAYGEKVNVSGDVYFPLVPQEFTCALENPLVKLVAQN